MVVLSARSVILLVCTLSAFWVGGRAPGAVNLRTREIEIAITPEGKGARDKRSAALRPVGTAV